MNEINIANDKMTTLQFVELTGTTHDNVLKKARKLLKDLGIDAVNFNATYIDKSKRESVMLELNKDLALTLAGQYKPRIAYAVRNAFRKYDSDQALKPAVPTMSSTELANITGKRHDNVVRDITTLLNGLGIDPLNFEENEIFANNRTRTVYNLPKRECDLLMMGYSIPLRAKVYDRWVELEAGEAKPTLQQNVPLQAIPSNDPLTLALQAVTQTRLDMEVQVRATKVQAEKLAATAKEVVANTEAVKDLNEAVNRHGCPEGYITLSKFKADGSPYSANVLKSMVKYYRTHSKRYSHIAHGHTQYVTAYRQDQMEEGVLDWDSDSTQEGKMSIHLPTGVRYRTPKHVTEGMMFI